MRRLSMYCPNCGSALEGNPKFCPNCGSAIIGGAKNQDTSQPLMTNESQPQQQIIQSPRKEEPRSKEGRGTKKKKKKKGSCLTKVLMVVGILFLLGILGSMSGSNKNINADSEEKTETEEVTSETEDISEEEDQSSRKEDSEDNLEKSSDEEWKGPEKIDYSIPLEDLASGGYAYVTLADLDRYVVNMTGQNIYTVIQIDKIEEDRIQADISDGFMFQTFETIYDYTPYFKEGDTVAIFGTVGNTESLLGADWTHIQNCQVFAYGDEAKSYIRDTTDESLAGFLTLTEAVANSEGKNNISEEEFKSLCQYYSYEDILRNPDNYKKKYVVLSGTVDQTVEGAFGLYTTIYIRDGNDNKWGCNITYSEGQSRILEGDYVTVYGTLNGTTTSRTVLGQQVTMPYIDIQYVE